MTPSTPLYFNASIRAAIDAHNRGDIHEALRHAKAAANLNPRNAELLSTVGAFYHDLKDYPAALTWHRRAIALPYVKAEIYSNFANTLRVLGDLEGALTWNYKAAKKDKSNSMVHNNLGCIWTELGDCPRALHEFDKAISYDPQNFMAYFNKGNAMLLSGDYSSEAWEHFDYRTLCSLGGEKLQQIPLPWWTGEDLNGKGIYIEIEQGQGDTFQFCRLIFALRERYPDARITFQVSDGLFSVMERNLGHICKVVAGNYKMRVADYDYRLQLMHLCRVFPDYEGFSPYLMAPSSDPVRNGKMRVGFCWKGNPEHRNDHNRSMLKGEMFSLLSYDYPWQSYSLQKGEERKYDVITSLPLNTWEQAFQSVWSLDLIITVDTSIAHVAGALGKPVWLLIPKAPDWRWGLTGERTRWYPSMKIFRQELRGNWKPVIEKVCSELNECVKTGAPLV